MNFQELYAILAKFFGWITPHLVKFMVFALPIAFALGNFFKSIINPISQYFPTNMMYIYLIIAVLIMILGGIYNYKYPYRKLKKKYDDEEELAG